MERKTLKSALLNLYTLSHILYKKKIPFLTHATQHIKQYPHVTRSYAKDIQWRWFISGKRNIHFLKVGGAPLSRNCTTKVVTAEFTIPKWGKKDKK